LADRHGIAIRQSGPPQMPLMLFDADPEFLKGRAFCSAALRRGAFFHPQHNMFLSAAHGPDDIDAALEAAAHGFKAVTELDARVRTELATPAMPVASAATSTTQGVAIRPLAVATIQRLPQRTMESIRPIPGTVSPSVTLRTPSGP